MKMQEITVRNTHTIVEVYPHPGWYVVQINTPQGMIRHSFSVTENEIDLIVTALLMLKDQLSKVSQA
jgi:hypothetical protein